MINMSDNQDYDSRHHCSHHKIKMIHGRMFTFGILPTHAVYICVQFTCTEHATSQLGIPGLPGIQACTLCHMQAFVPAGDCSDCLCLIIPATCLLPQTSTHKKVLSKGYL